MAEKYTAGQIIEALKASKGMIYVAARKMGCSHQTIRNYAKRYPSIRETIQEERGLFVDNAEVALEKAIRRGEGWAVCFTLKTLGKDRGYVERQELSGPDGGPIEVDIAGLSDEERFARIMALLERARERRDNQTLAASPIMGAIAGPAD